MEGPLPRATDQVVARSNQRLGEAGLVALVALLSTVLYVGRIGFYTDDWFFIGALFQHAPDHSYLGLLLSCLSYELLIPLFALAPLLAWHQQRQLAAHGEATAGPRTPLLLLARNWLLLAAVMGFKIFTTNRAEGGFDALGQLVWFAGLQRDAFEDLLIGPYGVRMPRMVQRALFEYFDPVALLLSLAVGALVFVALFWRPSHPDDRLPELRTLLRLAALGLVLFVAGYAIFLTNRQAIITATGINNRSSSGAVFGITLLIVAGAGIAARLLRREQLVNLAFALIIAAYAGGSTLAVTTLGNLWAAANQEQHAIMVELRTRFPTPAHGSSIIIDGYCPYIRAGNGAFVW